MQFVTGYQGFFNPNQNVTIAQGAQESDPLNCGGMVLSGLILPAIFTGTAITFEVGDAALGYQAKGQITLSGLPSNADTLVINGTTVTFVSANPSALQVLIGGTAAETATNLKTVLAASTDANLLLCTYAVSGAVVMVTAILHGTAGNAYTFTESTANLTIVPNSGTLLGGGFRALYDASNSLVSMTVAQNRAYAIDPKNFQGVSFLIIKSGSAELAQRTLICSLKGF